jgi:hypothetical protein
VSLNVTKLLSLFGPGRGQLLVAREPAEIKTGIEQLSFKQRAELAA